MSQLKAYYVNNNAQPGTYDHEVHVEGCPWLPLIVSKVYLGDFASSAAAVEYAQKYYYRTADGCATCCPESHTS